MGLPYIITLNMPLDELMDLISIQQIKVEGYRYRKPEKMYRSAEEKDEAEWAELLKLR